MKPQALLVLKLLRKGVVLTIINAGRDYGVGALSQRIGEIKRDASVSDVIVSERVPGKSYHRYYIKGAARFGNKDNYAPIVVRQHTRKRHKVYDNPELFGG